jgi:serine/threonine protein kinase
MSNDLPSSSLFLDAEPSPVGFRGGSSQGGESGPRRRFGKYRVIARLGEGGMAQVHLALMRGPVGFNKLLVVKSMREGLTDPIYARSFMHEARLAAQLNHANVVQTYEVGEHQGQLFIAMEYVEGQSLRAVQRRLAPQRLPLAVYLRILVDVARGLHHAHELRSFDGKPLAIVHRDVSPQNIMLSYEGQTKLLDFGIAKANGSDELTREGMIKGKVDYMAPEQLTGAPVDHRADIFPLGALLWEAIAGARFSGGAEVAEVTKIHNRVMGAERKLSEIAPDAPTRLVDIVNRAISLDRSLRQPTAAAFANELADYLSETSRSTDSRRLADILAPVFERDRAKLRKVIDEQVKLAEKNDDNVDDVADPLPVFTTSDSQSQAPEENQEIASLKASLVAQQRARELESKGGKRVTAVAAVSIVALVAVVAAMTSRESRSRDMAPPAGAPTSAVAAPALPSAEASRIEISVRVTPSNAEVTLDGARIEMPFSARIEPDARIHHVVASLDGYEPEERAVVFDADVDLRLTLRESSFEPLEAEVASTSRRSARARRRAAAATRPATTSSHRESTSPVAPTVMRRPAIDQTDPYQ